MIDHSWISKLLRWGGIYMTFQRVIMLFKNVTSFWEFGYLNCSCIRKSIIFMFLSSSGEHLRFCGKTQWHISVGLRSPSLGGHLDGHQHGVSIQISIKLSKKFIRISRLTKLAVTWILTRVCVFTVRARSGQFNFSIFLKIEISKYYWATLFVFNFSWPKKMLN